MMNFVQASIFAGLLFISGIGIGYMLGSYHATEAWFEKYVRSNVISYGQGYQAGQNAPVVDK